MEVHDDDQDRLLDMLLREELGGERPPHLAERILQRAAESRTARWRPRLSHGWIAAAAVAAAMVAIALLLRLLPSEPARVALPNPPPDKIIHTEKDGRVVELGGFCRVALAPFSTIEDLGEGKEQRIALKEGGVACEVDSKQGRFMVEHELGRVVVTGTKFQVRLNAEHHGEKTLHSRLSVEVEHGAVRLDSPGSPGWGETVLKDGQKGGTLIGTVANTGKNFIEVRADGEERAVRYVPRWISGAGNGGFDPHMLELLRQYPKGSRVRMMWMFDEHNRILGIGPAAMAKASP